MSEDIKQVLETKKIGSLVYSTFCEGECDFCTTDAFKGIHAGIREEYPEWFADDGKGNLLTEYSDICCKKTRTELAKQVKKQRVWQVNCGFCTEPFGVCSKHLQEILDSLKLSL